MRRLAIGLTALALTSITACGSGQTARSDEPTGEGSPEQSEQSLSPLSSTAALGEAVSRRCGRPAPSR
ncbi:hypothetical protein [Actinopolyspora erythraea]|uniref:hypothetical protein n=1 Tax=Actinopolyspora erythraea TaxID=414996 RepID=UPI0011869C70|nr:hypothetical protein [Actinopolyspora erythraea]